MKDQIEKQKIKVDETDSMLKLSMNSILESQDRLAKKSTECTIYAKKLSEKEQKVKELSDQIDNLLESKAELTPRPMCDFESVSERRRRRISVRGGSAKEGGKGED